MENQFDKNWDDYAQSIYPRKESKEWQVLKVARESHFNEFFNIKPGEKILDAGCGLGEYTIYSLQQKAKVWAFDYSIEMVNLTNEQLHSNSLRAEKVTVDSVTDIPYPNDFFDQVFCLAVLDHVDNEARVKGMSELSRVLKPGGRLVIDVPNRFAYHWRLVFYTMRLFKLYPKGNIHFFTPFEVSRILKKNGFTKSKTLGLTILPPFSGIYTTNLKRHTIFPEPLIRVLDRLYLKTEISLRRVPMFKPICWHYFVEAIKN